MYNTIQVSALRTVKQELSLNNRFDQLAIVVVVFFPTTKNNPHTNVTQIFVSVSHLPNIGLLLVD